MNLPPLTNIALVALGGMIGALLRVGLAVAVPNPPDGFPWTTFLENVVGAYLLGLLLAVLARRFPDSDRVRLLLGTGLLGSFTTFSNYSVEIVQLATDSPAVALAYALASVIVALAAALAGLASVGRGAARAGEATT